MEQIQTSSKKKTIWRPLNENTFFTNVREIAGISGGVPGMFRTFQITSLATNYAQTLSDWLPLEVEHQLVNDLAFLAAASEGALSVSALTVSKNSSSVGMVIRVTANSGVSKEVLSSLQAICQELQRRARDDIDRRICIDALFNIVVKLHENRIHGRIESKYWKPPPYLKGRPVQAFYEDFYPSMCAFIPTSRKSSKDDFEIVRASERLHDSMRSISQANDISGLKDIVRRAYQLSGTHQSFAARLFAAGYADIAGKKLVRTVDKLGRYLKCCERLAKMASSRGYKQCFRDIEIVALDPFEPRTVLTNKRHIHAEIQLITFFTLHPTISRPRVIGISKATCYLCNLFLSHYPQYLVSATHGSIFENWSIPDLAAYTTANRLELRGIIGAINQALIKQAKKRSKFMATAQSGIWHDPCQLSTSSRITVSSLVSNKTVRGATTPDIVNGKGVTNELSSELAFQSQPGSHIEHAVSVLNQKISLDQDLALCTSSAPFPKALHSVGLAPSAEYVPLSRVVLESNPGTLTPQMSSTPDLVRVPAAVMEYCHATSTTSELKYVLEDIMPQQMRSLKVDGLRLCFEIESGHKSDNTTVIEGLSSKAPDVVGRSTVQKISNMVRSNEFEVIDLHSLLPGVDIMLQKPDTSKALGFVLQNGSNGALQVSCEWSSYKE